MWAKTLIYTHTTTQSIIWRKIDHYHTFSQPVAVSCSMLVVHYPRNPSRYVNLYDLGIFREGSTLTSWFTELNICQQLCIDSQRRYAYLGFHSTPGISECILHIYVTTAYTRLCITHIYIYTYELLLNRTFLWRKPGIPWETTGPWSTPETSQGETLRFILGGRSTFCQLRGEDLGWPGMGSWDMEGGGFFKKMCQKNSHFNRVFHHFHHPFWRKHHYFWETPIYLAGGLKYLFEMFLIFTPKIGEDEPNLTSIFLRWVGSTTNQINSQLQLVAKNANPCLDFLDFEASNPHLFRVVLFFFLV